MLIRRSKTDTVGQGATAYLSRETVRNLQGWLASAQITEGALFRRLIGQHRVGERLHADIIADIYKRVAAYIGMPAKRVAQVSGHSIRVGATQNLLALNIDLASVMQAGRWKSTVMPMRYGEEVLAARGGMARAAEKQGRDSDTTVIVQPLPDQLVETRAQAFGVGVRGAGVRKERRNS